MLIQTGGAPHYARGVSPRVGAAENANRLAREHLLKFWPSAIVEGRAVAQGHVIDADEPADPLDVMDHIDQHEPEAMGGRIAAQLGEFFLHEGVSESPCVTCQNLWCAGANEDVCHNETATDVSV